MSLTAALLGAAERYLDLGIPIVPVAGKKALIPWRKPPKPEDVLRVIESDPRTTGLAAILGGSANLVVRDFDDPAAWEAWRSRNPELVKRLPLSGTARGGHAWAITPGAKTVNLADGELRAGGSYVVVPPSLTVNPPPGGRRQYEWLNPLPRSLDLIPRIDLRIFLPDDHSSIQQSTEGEGPGPPNPPKPHVCGALGGISIPEFIARTIPTGPGQRHHRLFDLARLLRAALPADTAESEIRAIGAEWFRQARATVRTQDPRVTQRDLVDAWRLVELPAGWSWSRIVETAAADAWQPRLGSGAADRAARLLRAAGQAHGGGPFFLDYRRIGEAIQTTPRSAYDAAHRVVAAGLVELIDRGSRRPKDRRATVWRWVGP